MKRPICNFYREANPHIKRIVKPFDWTFTPVDYFGTPLSSETGETFVVQPTGDFLLKYPP